MIEEPELKDSYTSTGAKLYFHQEAMQRLRNGYGTPISAWCAPTDICNAKCSFCSVGERIGDVLPYRAVKGFVDQLAPLGLKSITFSGGGNFLMYRCKETGKDCSDIIRYVKGLGIECALITNGMPMVKWYDAGGEWVKESDIDPTLEYLGARMSWKNMPPDVLDMLTWCRISMAGLDANHKEQQVYVPDFDQSKTSLGFSWIMADSYQEPGHKHGWVSTPEDIRTPLEDRSVVIAEDRLPWIEQQIRHYVEKHNPSYCRLLANCLQPDRIASRHRILSDMAERINPQVVFSQNKPPRNPGKSCAKIYTRPCLNADGFVFCCDSVVLNRTANHKFGSDWRVCRWDEIGELFSKPIRKVIPDGICPGCVFPDAVELIGEIIEGRETPVPEGPPLEHVNYI